MEDQAAIDRNRYEEAVRVSKETAVASGEYLLQFFAYAHLPPHLQVVSAPFGELAEKLVNVLPKNPERTTALRKLIEAKDCAVRALLFKWPTTPGVP